MEVGKNPKRETRAEWRLTMQEKEVRNYQLFLTEGGDGGN